MKKFSLSLMLSLALLTMAVAVIYQGCSVDYVRGEQVSYMKERYYFPDDSQWLIHSMSYNRLRLEAKGDYFLFRPGFNLLTGLIDIFLRDQMLVTGCLSIVFHLMAVILLYMALSVYFSGAPAFFFALFFATQYSGIDLIVWHHMSPYMLSVVLAMAVWMIFYSRFRQKEWLAFFVLFLAALFHEFLSASLVFFLAVLSPFVFSRQRQDDLRTLFMTVGKACGLYWLLDLLNWMATKPPSFFMGTDKVSFTAAFVKTAIVNFFLFLGISTKAVFNPFGVNLVWDRHDLDRFKWDAFHTGGYFWWAAAAALFLTFILWQIIRRMMQKQERPCDVITLWTGCGLISLTILFSLGRMTVRSSIYSISATYYYWFYAFFYAVLLKYAIDLLMEKFPSIKKLVVLGFCALLLAASLAQGWKAKMAIEKNYNIHWAEILRVSIASAEDYFQQHPNVCLDPEMQRTSKQRGLMILLPLHLHRFNCDGSSSKQKVHFTINENGGIEFHPGPYVFPRE